MTLPLAKELQHISYKWIKLREAGSSVNQDINS